MHGTMKIKTISLSHLPAKHMMSLPTFEERVNVTHRGNFYTCGNTCFRVLPDFAFTFLDQTVNFLAPQRHQTAAMLLHLSNLSIISTLLSKDINLLLYP